ncbi:hypothetical protein [Roseomonas sp. AR75]|uniref:hypothetical protein n=1 Tax=Roseomonas sp. AR75 TaxID=2562311 RepID=UPI0010BF9D5A|nr:hypothetical protein [Roseomonas sp. AR75]
MIHAEAPDTPINTIGGSIHDLRVKGDEIEVPTKGLWVLKNSALPTTVVPVVSKGHGKNNNASQLAEVSFYEPLANWLRDEADEVTEAFPLGGAGFKDKWGTPDVVGVLKPKTGDFVPFPLEIVAVELKIDPYQSITAFGQVCAYRLFSHRVYLAMPETIPNADRDRLESLCSLFGIGLIFFESDSSDPSFRLEVRAIRNSPDMFYANDFARRLHRAEPKIFHKLF